MDHVSIGKRTSVPLATSSRTSRSAQVNTISVSGINSLSNVMSSHSTCTGKTVPSGNPGDAT